VTFGRESTRDPHGRPSPYISVSRASRRIGRSPPHDKILRGRQTPYMGSEAEPATKYGGCNLLYGGILAKIPLSRFGRRFRQGKAPALLCGRSTRDQGRREQGSLCERALEGCGGLSKFFQKSLLTRFIQRTYKPLPETMGAVEKQGGASKITG